MKKFFKKFLLTVLFIIAVSTIIPTGAALAASGEFSVNQMDTTKFTMTFAGKTDVKPADVKVVVVIKDTEYDVPIKKITVEDNLAIVELYTTFMEGHTYKVTYAKETHAFVGGIGTIDTVSFHYWTLEEGDNAAYVSTEVEPVVITLEHELYDANGVDITNVYDEEDLQINYALITQNENTELYGDKMVCNKTGVVEIEIKVAWTSEDGTEHERTSIGTVVITKRASITFGVVEAGFINVEEFESGAQDSFVYDVQSPFWINNSYLSSWTLGDEGELQFAAVIQDSRGNTITTGINDYGYNYPEDEEGNALYPYGYFKFVPFNEEIVDVDETGLLTFYGHGTATILIYFVDITGNREKEVFVGVAPITVNPERYVATYALDSVSHTIASVTNGIDNTASYVLTAFDQYGKAIPLKYGAEDIKVETTSYAEDIPMREAFASESTLRIINSEVVNCTDWGCGNSNGGVHYHIDFDGDSFKEFLGDNSARTIYYMVTVDKESNSMLSKDDSVKIKLTIKNTEEYVEQLKTGTVKNFYYSVESNKTSQDLAVTNIKNYVKTHAEAVVKHAEISLNYQNASNGLVVQAVPQSKIVKKVKNQKEGEVGKIYYEITAPTSAKNWSYEIADGKIIIKWNVADGRSTLKYATTGTYKVVLYTAKKGASGKLSELGTYTFDVTNSQAEPKLDVYGSILCNKTSVPISKESALAIVKENFKFVLDGTPIDWTNPEYQIKLKSSTVNEEKLLVKTVEITVPIDDGDASTNYTYVKTLTINKSVYYQEEE